VSWWEAVVLGLVEGITEFLPVSSTGHLILASALLGLDDPSRKAALDAFEVVVQGGAVLAVLGLYRARVRQLGRGLLGRDPGGQRLLGHLALAFLPAAGLGALLGDAAQRLLFHPGPVLAALFLGGVWMIFLARGRPTGAAEITSPGRFGIDGMSWRVALGIGLFQCAALWPGTSRSMMTIAGGVLLGLRSREAAEFSFLLGVPTLGAASLYSLARDLLRAAGTGGPTLFEELGAGAVALGVAVATLSAALAVRWLVAFFARHGLAAFGWYRIGLALLLGGLLSAGAIDLE
jgi:undecaprenyl-diphosphatase